ncbi:CopD family protein [Acuticoccus sp. I52.16.1]|uniref:CopD family protein n=1 Tax=Acuticoccus sp. I52.16.1 TaxID=2928472 RepID=UPI001FD1FF7D|nr:CopD family protein [Acuticoccus sp. I52.16.1]UOM32579.1 CopD family protein [Acuticoccus sp. I52.16.1]
MLDGPVLSALTAAVPLFKSVHIAALLVWAGGLVALPLMLARHDPAVSAADYDIIRRATHVTYTLCVTPAAVIAVIAGTWLIFLREVFTPWLYAKLAFVALLVVAHAWVGHILAKVAEEPGEHTPPSPWLPIAAVAIPVVAILVLVLGKPALAFIEFPDWLTVPRGRQLLFDVPSR